MAYLPALNGDALVSDALGVSPFWALGLKVTVSLATLSLGSRDSSVPITSGYLEAS